jgi:predicted nucleic acid-binding protein
LRYLLDTNVISEAFAARPDPAVARWFGLASEDDLALSVISVAEIKFGIELMAAGKRKQAHSDWLNIALAKRFAGKILPVTHEIADVAGQLLAVARRKGRNGDFNDALIAATAMAHSLSVVTRNTKDFKYLQVTHINPWVA